MRAGGLRMIRPSAETPGQYDLCEPFENGKGWTWLDAVTANVVCQVHDALSPDRREKFEALPAKVILEHRRKTSILKWGRDPISGPQNTKEL